MPKLNCIDRYGQPVTFDVSMTKSCNAPPTWDFAVTNIPPLANGEFFELSLQEIQPGIVRVIVIENHHQPEYSGKNIPVALFQFAFGQLVRTIISSPTAGVAGVWRTPAATKMWKQIQNMGKASYDAVNDIFTFIP